ncbi:excalibur calcium-binding domain-containing protein [Streptomyces sp. NPDC002125]
MPPPGGRRRGRWPGSPRRRPRQPPGHRRRSRRSPPCTTRTATPRAAGAAPVRRGEPGYAAHLDRDGDGVGCEPYGSSGSSGGTSGGSSSGGSVGGSGTYYANCTAVRAAGAAPIHRGDPGYGSHLDRDGDGVACE